MAKDTIEALRTQKHGSPIGRAKVRYIASMDYRNAVKGRTCSGLAYTDCATTFGSTVGQKHSGHSGEMQKAAFSLQMSNTMTRGYLLLGSPFYLEIREGPWWIAYKNSRCMEEKLIPILEEAELSQSQLYTNFSSEFGKYFHINK